MAFTAKDVKSLREKTGCGMMDCKKALTQANGDMSAASDILREKGLAAANKKSSRVAAEGLAFSCLDDNGDVGAVIEVNSETDFVAKNVDFQNFVKTCAQTVIKENSSTVEELLSANAFGTDSSVEKLLQEKILTIGENIKIRRFKRYEGVLASYIHAAGRIGVLVKFDTTSDVSCTDEFKVFAKDIAMQIAAVNPKYLNKDSVDPSEVEHEKKILTEQVVNSGKPLQVAEKIVLGRMGKFFQEICLTEQAFVKDSSLTVQQYTDTIAKNLSGKIKIVDFVRFEKGEGLEKREDNFADEVANMVK